MLLQLKNKHIFIVNIVYFVGELPECTTMYCFEYLSHIYYMLKIKITRCALRSFNRAITGFMMIFIYIASHLRSRRSMLISPDQFKMFGIGLTLKRCKRME